MKPIIYLAAFVLAATAYGVVSASDAVPDRFAYEKAETVTLGKALYGDYCAACHGENLEGQANWQIRDADGYLPAPPHDASGHTWHHPDDQLFEITKFGTEAMVGGDYKSNMVGFGDDLSDAEIRAILAYIKSTWPARIIARHDQLNAAYDEATRP